LIRNNKKAQLSLRNPRDAMITICVKIDIFSRPFATGLETGFGGLKNVWFKSAVVNCAV